ncbi:glycoside hydrolase family 5 protein [Marinimicrobium sp. C2-29]|uniref:glycoside hydrolase family 5 protein n=1 Tax=Marinimicrobium sp. C2-29 TaxID=3139825 RepID=UPI00313A1C51
MNTGLINRRIAPAGIVVALFLLTACGSSGGATNSSAAHSSETSASSASNSSGSASSDAARSSSSARVEPAEGFQVQGDTLYDNTGVPFVMRGVNYPYAWFRSSYNTEQQFADIASTGANTVRVVLANGEQWNRVSGDEVENIIGWAKQHQLVTMLEVHDATGWSEKDSAANPQTAVDYWLSEDVTAAITGEEAYVLINIANEPLGNNRTDEWVPFHTGAIEALREGGLTHTLVVDAPNWGQDWKNVMRDGDGALTIFNADDQRNVVFSVHMYDVYGDAAEVDDYFQSFSSKSVPLIVGEFAADHGAGNEVAEEAILAGAEAYGFGYLGWSWSGNTDGGEDGTDLSSLDIVENFNVDTLSSWGETLIDSENGIRATSETCQCFLGNE